MYIIVVGGGKVGEAAARELVASGHEVLVIEREPERVHAITDELGDVAIIGDGTEVRTLAEAGAGRADLVVAATGRDEANLTVAQIAKQRFGITRVIARINNPKNEAIFRVLDVAIPVSATQAIMAQIEQELPSHPLIRLLELHQSEFELVEVVVPEGAGTVGQRVSALSLPPRAMLLLVVQPDGTPELPLGDTLLQGGSAVLAVTLPEHEAALRRVLTGDAD